MVYKQILKPGVGETVNLERNTVTYDYAMFIESSVEPFDSSHGVPGIVCVQQGLEPLPGYYLSLSSMKFREESIFWISSDLLFGKSGCPPRVPPSADVIFYARIMQVTKSEEPEDDKVANKAETFKKLMKEAKANLRKAQSCFEDENFDGACRVYKMWIKKLEDVRMSSDIDEEKQKYLLKKFYLNLCVTYNKLNLPKKACIEMRELEKLEPIRSNPRALYVKGKALMMLNDFDRAYKYFKMAERVHPGSETIAYALNELNQMTKAKQEQEAKESDVYEKTREHIRLQKERLLQKAEEQRKQDEYLQVEIEKFQAKFKELVITFKNDKINKRCSLIDVEIKSLEVAADLCKQNEIKLHFVSSNGQTEYYLSKE